MTTANRHTSAGRRMFLLTCLLLAAYEPRLADAAPSCAASCVTRMAACRAERCPAATGTDRRRCREVCRAVTGCAAGGARIRTVAAIVNECRSAGGMWTGRQRLEIRRGDCPPVTVMTIEAKQPAPDPPQIGICQLYGQIRDGGSAMAIGAFEGLAVSPDGDLVVFQVTDDFVGRLAIGATVIPSPGFALPAEGIYVVHPDGSGLRRIADQSREAPFAVVPMAAFPGIRVNVRFSKGFSFSPDGRIVVFTDRGTGADGSDAPQIVTLDARTGTRRQLTSFSASAIAIPPGGLPLDAWFLDDEQIGGSVYDPVVGWHIFRIRPDGRDFHYVDVQRIAPPGATVVPTFRISGLFDNVSAFAMPTRTDQPVSGPVREIFVWDGDHVVQLTNLGRSDTLLPIRSRDRQHVFFHASGDPRGGMNPSSTCQLFSIDALGGHLRQLTHFEPLATSPMGCTVSTTEGCFLGGEITVQDPSTGALVLDSTCDPFGLGATGDQIYAMRPDGSGFRQLTSYRGMTTDSDGTVSVELPGPVAYQSLIK
jgi:hypothetical protein